MKVEQRRALRDRLARPGPVVAPGVYDCISAKLVEQAGFEAATITGAGLAASVLGVPDVGLITMSEVLAQTRNIAHTVGIPIVADCDTGYGNELNVMRTVREFENAGVAALFIEDQVTPKRCGHFRGKQVISCAEMVRKIEAAVEARTDADLLLMVRTDAIAIEGLDGAVARAKAYVAAGAEIMYVEAPETREQLERIPELLRPLGVPLYMNLVEGGQTPLYSVAELEAMGYKFLVFSGSLQKTAISAMRGFLGSLRRTGSVEEFYPSWMVGLDERSALLGLPELLALSDRYAADRP